MPATRHLRGMLETEKRKVDRVFGTEGLFGFLDNYYLVGNNIRRFEVLPVVDCFISSEAFFKSIGVEPTRAAIIRSLSTKRLGVAEVRTYEWQAGCVSGVEGGHADDVLAGVIITVAVILLPVISHTLLLPSDSTFKA